MLPPELIEIISDFMHCDLVEIHDGYELVLRPCTAFEIRWEDNRHIVFPCLPS